MIACLLMFGFAFYQGTTVLYVAAKFRGTINNSYEVNAVFSALVYLSSALAGMLSQRFMDARFGLWFGLLLYGVGNLLTATNHFQTYTLGLSIFALGYGFLYTNVFYLLGKLYKTTDNRREGGFTLAYLGFNVGSVFAFILGGLALQDRLYKPVTFVIGLFFILVCCFLFLRYRKILTNSFSVNKLFTFFTLTLSFIVLMWIFLYYAHILELYLSVICLVALLFIFLIAFKERQNPQEAKKLVTLGALTLVAVIYWSVYKLQDSLFLYFFQHDVKRQLLGFTIPTTSLLSVNPIVILLVSPAISYLWLKTGNRFNSPTAKVVMGLLVFSVGFIFMTWGVNLHLPTALGYIILFLIFVSISETIFGPGTISMVGQLAQSKYQPILLGLVQLSSSVASIISGELAVGLHDHFLLSTDNLSRGYSFTFYILSAILILGAIIAISIRKAMR